MTKSSIDEPAPDIHELKEIILAKVLSAGVVAVRVVSPFTPGSGANKAFCGAPLPEQYREGAPALLVAALPYGNQHNTAAADSGDPAGIIAPFARRNYYREAVKRLQKLSLEFRSQFGGKKADYRILCNSPVPEKPLAVASGLGVMGRNGLLITKEAGSLVILAAMTVPFPLEPDGPLLDPSPNNPFPLCAACGEKPPCAAACPTGALTGTGTIDLDHCIQWFASGKGGDVPKKVAAKWGNRFYGCTECQDACIHNQRPIKGVETEEGILPPSINPRELLSMDDLELKALFKNTALGLSWLGPDVLRRSARHILKNQDISR